MPRSGRAVCHSVAGRDVTARQRSNTGVQQSQEQGPAAASSPHPQLQMGGAAPQHAAHGTHASLGCVHSWAGGRRCDLLQDVRIKPLPPVLTPSAKGCGWSGVQRSPEDILCHGQSEPIPLAF